MLRLWWNKTEQRGIVIPSDCSGTKVIPIPRGQPLSRMEGHITALGILFLKCEIEMIQCLKRRKVLVWREKNLKFSVPVKKWESKSKIGKVLNKLHLVSAVFQLYWPTRSVVAPLKNVVHLVQQPHVFQKTNNLDPFHLLTRY